MRRIVISILVLGLAVAPAMAQNTPIPNYDIAAYCHENPGSTGEHACVNDQYLLRSGVALHWTSLSESVRKECIAVDKWGDYRTLWNCTNNR